MGPVRASLRKLARTTKPPPRQRTTIHRMCVVDHTTAGASADGVTAVFVRLGSDVFPAPYPAHYDAAGATVGDQVRVAFDDGSPFIEAKVVGLPNLT